MNKQELITRNSGVKLYDLSDPIDLHRMNMNLAYCSKKGKEPSFKLIAPFGHPLKFKADFYYFESEKTPITEQILEEMKITEKFLNCFRIKINQDMYINVHESKFIVSINRNILYNIKTANQLHQLIELLK